MQVIEGIHAAVKHADRPLYAGEILLTAGDINTKFFHKGLLCGQQIQCCRHGSPQPPRVVRSKGLVIRGPHAVLEGARAGPRLHDSVAVRVGGGGEVGVCKGAEELLHEDLDEAGGPHEAQEGAGGGGSWRGLFGAFVEDCAGEVGGGGRVRLQEGDLGGDVAADKTKAVAEVVEEEGYLGHGVQEGGLDGEPWGRRDGSRYLGLRGRVGVSEGNCFEGAYHLFEFETHGREGEGEGSKGREARGGRRVGR